MNINDILSHIAKSYENGILYKQEWDFNTQQLKTLTGPELFKAEICHFFLSSYQENQFIQIFSSCISSLDPNFNGSCLSTDALKVISRYCKLNKEIILNENLSKLISLFKEKLQIKRERLGNCENFTPAQIIQKREKIEELYSLESEADDESKKIKAVLDKTRKLYLEVLPKQAFLAHYTYDSIWNKQTALKIAEEKIDSFEELRNHSDPKVKQYALELFTYVKYGYDAPEVVGGSQNPSLFWDVKRIWNTCTNFFSEEKKISNKNFSNLQGYDKKFIQDLINKPYAYMDDRLLVNYRETLKKNKVNLVYFNLGPIRKYRNITQELERNGFFKNNENFLFVPFVFKPVNRLYPDHIVLITFDRQAREIQYYDSQALPPDHPDRCADGFNVLEKMRELGKFWNEQEKEQHRKQDIKIVTNLVIHQEDIHNCGVYVCDAIKRRLKGESFEDLCYNGKNITEITKVRDELAEEIINSV